MSVGSIRIVMELDDKAFTVKMMRAGKVIRKVKREVAGMGRSFKRMERGINGVIPRLRDFLLTSTLLKNGLIGLTRATVGWQFAMANNIGEIERMTFLLKGMSNAATEAGRTMEAQENLEYLLDLAERSPFSLGEMTNAFVKFKSVGIDPMNGSLKSLNDAVASFGGNDQILHRSAVAIQQMAGKGVISMEELRQQLGEAVPNAIKLMARSMDLTYGELVTKIARGQVEAQGALRKMFGEFERSMGGSSERMMTTWAGMLSKLKTRWLKFQLAIGEGGFFKEVKIALEEVLDAFNEDNIQSIGQRVGEMLASFIRGLKSTIESFIEFRDVIWGVVKAVGALFIWGKLVKLYKYSTAAISATSLAMAQLGRATVGATSQTAAFAMANTASTRAIGYKVASLARLKVAMAFVGGPLGVLITLIGTAVYAWYEFGNTAEKALEKVKKSLYGTTQKDLDGLSKGVKDTTAEVEKYTTAVVKYKKLVSDGYFVKDKLAQYMEKLRLASAKLLEYETNFNAAKAHIQEVGMKKRQEAILKSLDEDRKISQGYYKEQSKILDVEKKNGHRSDADNREIRLMLAQAGYDDEISALKDHINKYEMVGPLRPGVKFEDRGANNLEDTQDLIFLQNLLKAKIIANAIQMKVNNEKSKDATGNAGVTVRDLSKYLNRATVRLAVAKVKMDELKGATNGMGVALARFNALLKSGAFGKDGQNKDFVKKTRDMMEQLDAQNLANKAESKSQNIKRQSIALLKKVTLQHAEARKNMLSPVDAKDTFVERINAQVEALIAKIPKAKKNYDEFVASIRARGKNTVDEAIFTDLANKTKEFNEEAINIHNSLLTNKERLSNEYAVREAEILAGIAQVQEVGSEDMVANVNARYALLANLQEKYLRDTEKPIQSWARKWVDTTEEMDNAVVKWANSAADAILKFTQTGKFSFKDMANSIINDIARIMIKKQLAGMVGAMFGAPGGGEYSGVAGDHDSMMGAYLTKSANGNVMTSDGPMALQKYSKGGIANRPQLSLFGEGSQPEAYVPLPDGRSIPVTMSGSQQGANVVVNVINQSGTEVSAEQGQPKFDGERMVLDVVLKAVNKPGSFRSGMKGALR